MSIYLYIHFHNLVLEYMLDFSDQNNISKGVFMPRKKEQHYDGADIQVLEGLEAVRKRPGMYIGSTGSRGLHHLVYEIVDNSVDEALAGYCDNITVTLRGDGAVVVADNGRGIPVDMHPKEKMPAVEVALTKLHAGGKFGQDGGYKVSGGLHGVGVSVVNALSVETIVEVRRDKKAYEISFERGITAEKLHEVGKSKTTGTTVTFVPDPEIFTETTRFDFDALSSRFREIAFLNKGLKITLIDERVHDEAGNARQEVFHAEGGLLDFISYINVGKETLCEPIYIDTKDEAGEVEVALQWTSSYNSNAVFSFANNINTHEGGFHLEGFRQAVTRVINDYARSKKILKDKDPNLTGDDVREGLSAIVSVKLHEPQFEGQTKTKLGNTEMRSLVQTAVAEGLASYFDSHAKEARTVIDKATAALKAREAAKRAREMSRKKSALEQTAMPDKLADCSSKDAAKNEIFIVEGDSAGGSAKQARNRDFQAIMPLRGKILNIEKVDSHKAMASDTIASLVLALGCGIGADFDINKLRYDKVIIMTDADVDGAHIRCLLLTFFYRFMPKLIEEGHIYVAQPPIFGVKKKNTRSTNVERYIYDETALSQMLKEMGGAAKFDVQRYKGLGEMDPEQLWETTMDPEGRKLLQVRIADDVRAERAVSELMGVAVEPRKEFIQKHAKNVRFLDV